MTPKQWQHWRERLGWSLTEAADALGISRRHYCRLESGERDASKNLIILADLLLVGEIDKR